MPLNLDLAAFLAWFTLQFLGPALPPGDPAQDLPAGRVSVCSQVYQGERW